MLLPPTLFSLLRRGFGDICRGYSYSTYRGQTVYVKHLGHLDHLRFEETQESFRQEALAKGARSEEQQLAYTTSKGLWSEGKETEIATQRSALIRFEEGKRALIVPSMIARHEEQIKEERGKLGRMLSARAEAMGLTAEVYAHQRLNDHYILHNVYSDVGLTTPLLTGEAFDELPDSEIQEIVEVYNAATEPCSDANLRLLAVQDFFISYYGLCGDDASAFFGMPISQMTYYQVRLASVGRHFRSIMEHTDMSRLPVEQRNDPDALETAVHAQRNQTNAAAEGRVPNVGLTKEDRKALGVQTAPTPTQNLDLQGLIKHAQRHSSPTSG